MTIKYRIKAPKHVELRGQYLLYKVLLKLTAKESIKITPTMSGHQWYLTTCTTNKQWWKFLSTMTSISTVLKSSKDNSNTRSENISLTKNSIWTLTAPFSRASRKKLATLMSSLTLSAHCIYTITLKTVINQCFSASRLLT